MEYTLFQRPSYWFNLSQIKKVEEYYKAQWMGSWDNGGSDFPDDIFYVENPDISKDHTHYFGLYKNRMNDALYIRKGDKAFSHPMIGCIGKDNQVFVSRYRHDMVNVLGCGVSLDGGRDYIKVSGNLEYYNKNKIEIIVEKNKFIFKKI